MVDLNARPQALDIDPAKTAMVVVDMQNAFASVGGMFDLAGLDISGAPAVIEVHKRLLAGCRTAGVRVVYLQIVYDPELRDAGGPDSPNYHKELGMIMMREKPELAGRLLVRGTWDAAIIDELAPELGDKVIDKTRYSGFCRTELDSYLRSEGITHLMFTGIATNICVESTARDAYFAELFPIIIEDAVNHSGPDFNRDAMLWNFEHVFGWVTCSEDVLAALDIETIAA
ncbi:MAG: cysteine hydrolase [Pseudomonadota bacterium]|nr:cysteine hydrolase [Pseudomonadota bacterium]